jgi:hypothetical protein
LTAYRAERPLNDEKDGLVGSINPAPSRLKGKNPGVEPLTWGEVAERLAGARYFWLHTTSRSGVPNATPMWGVMVDSVLYLYTQSRTRKARNLRNDSRVIVHLESASDVVIVHGYLNHVGHPGTYPDVVDAFERKYDRPEQVPFLPSSDPAFDVLYGLDPLHALTWCLPDTEASTRRWTTDSSPEVTAP